MFFNVKKSELSQTRNDKTDSKPSEISMDDVLRVAAGGCEVVGQTCHLDGHTVRCESYSVVCK